MRRCGSPGRSRTGISEGRTAYCVAIEGGPGSLAKAKSIVEPARELEIAAARAGARVLLVERYGFLGGLATAGLVAPILGHVASGSTTPIVEGLLKEMTERMHELDGAPAWTEASGEWGIRFDAEAFKRVADQMCEEAGVRLMLHSVAAGAVVEDGRIRALVVESKSGRQAVTGST